MTIEEWKPIEGYEELYEISNLGNIRSKNRKVSTSNGKNWVIEGKNRKCTKHKGYYVIGLTKNKKEKQYKVHRLVAQAFIPNPYNLPQVNHKDANGLNNNVDNLEWCDAFYNNGYFIRRERVSKSMTNNPKNNAKKVLCIETGEILPSANEWQRKYGYWQGVISLSCRTGKIKYGKHFKYV